MKRILRICRALFAIALCFILLVAATIQIQQRIHRYRAERLMANMHQIRLYQSSWTDAQKLMKRWGAWGHYDGTCTAANCQYEINVGDPAWIVGQKTKLDFLTDLFYWIREKGLFWGHIAGLRTTFTVHDGTIWRTSATVVVHVAGTLSQSFNPNPDDGEGSEYMLIVQAKSRPSLLSSSPPDWIAGGNDQLAVHPNYKVGRPGGCENCFAAHITYSTHAPRAEIERLNDFNFSCFTRFGKCQFLGDLLPAAWRWRLYDHFEPGHTWTRDIPDPPRPCDVPLWTLGRDFDLVLSVHALSTGNRKEWGGLHEVDQVKVNSTLKGAPWRNGLTLEAYPFPQDTNSGPTEIRERLVPGKDYILIAQDHFDDPPAPYLSLERCGVQEDTSEVRRELEEGFKLNDNLKDSFEW